MLQAYLEPMENPWDDPPASFVQGFMVLPNANVLSIRVPGVTHAEQKETARSMGHRIWRVQKEAFNGDSALRAYQSDARREMQAALPVWRDLIRYEVAGDDGARKLRAGERVPSERQRTIFYTTTSNSDSLSGLLVKWTLAAAQSNLPTIAVDNETGVEQTQGYFEKVVS